MIEIVLLYQKSIMSPFFSLNSLIFLKMIFSKVDCNMDNFKITIFMLKFKFTYNTRKCDYDSPNYHLFMLSPIVASLKLHLLFLVTSSSLAHCLHFQIVTFFLFFLHYFYFAPITLSLQSIVIATFL